MLLTFLCQKTAQMSVHGGVGGMWELLSEALKSLVLKVSNIYFYIFCMRVSAGFNLPVL